MVKKFSIIFMILITVCFSENALNKYKTIRFDGTDPGIPFHYTGSLFMSGCANASMNKMLREKDPIKIGNIDPKKITFFGDEDYPEEIYSFDSISYYEVTTNLDTFYIMYTSAKKDSINYEIIIELNAGSDYDRTLNIFQDGKLCTVILWVESLRVTQKGKDI